jgi:hypothetical protein
MEAVIIVCDRGDGKPATESIRFTLSGRNLQLDLCDRHLRELAAGAHPVKRGRQRALNGSASTTQRRSTAKKSTGRKATGKRRGRPPGSKNKPKG